MEDEPRGFVGALNVGKRRGRGEDWLAAQLVRRGHSPVQQYPVWKHTADERSNRYFIDIAVGRVAVELYSYWQAPWESESLVRRTTDLMMDGWSVFYVWLTDQRGPVEAVVDEVVRFMIDSEAKTKHSFRTVGYDGTLMRVGWLDNNDQFSSCDPDPEPAVPGPEWSREPPTPPTEVPSDEQNYRGSRRPNIEPSIERTLDEDNEIRRQWYEYNEAFDRWEAERDRRQKPWEILPPISRSAEYRRSNFVV